jgi:hypothetical protein
MLGGEVAQDDLGEDVEILRGGDGRRKIGDAEDRAQALHPEGLRDRAREPDQEAAGEALHEGRPDVLEPLLDPPGQGPLEEPPVAAFQADLRIMHHGIPAFHRSFLVLGPDLGPLHRAGRRP